MESGKPRSGGVLEVSTENEVCGTGTGCSEGILAQSIGGGGDAAPTANQCN